MTLFGRKTLTMIQGAKGASDAPDEPDVDSFVSGGGPGTTPVVASEPAVSLASVLSSDITLAWDEAVSIVEALCEAVQGSVLRTIPDATGIFLTGAGTVAVRSGAGTPEPVEAGRRLLELLGKTAVPAPLRLFASQSVREEQHSSIVEFQQGLNYFAKAGGRERIAAVYERCSRALAAMPFPSESDPQPAKALNKPKTPEPGERASRWRVGREIAIAGGALLVTVVAVSGGYVAWQELSKPSADPEAGAEVQKATVATKRPAGRRAETPTAAAGTPATGQPGPAAPGAAAGPAGSPNTPRPEPVDLEVVGLPPVPAVLSESTAVSAGTPVAGGASPPVSTAPLFVQGTPSEPLDLDRLYSSADAGLVPATLVRQQVLPPAMGVLEGVAPLRIELIVSAEGAVERARFMVPPRRMADMMMLSSAKMWTFNPALKDGRPVRSRVVLSWFVAP